jgi:hypothetical protein
MVCALAAAEEAGEGGVELQVGGRHRLATEVTARARKPVRPGTEDANVSRSPTLVKHVERLMHISPQVRTWHLLLKVLNRSKSTMRSPTSTGSSLLRNRPSGILSASASRIVIILGRGREVSTSSVLFSKGRQEARRRRARTRV